MSHSINIYLPESILKSDLNNHENTIYKILKDRLLNLKDISSLFHSHISANHLNGNINKAELHLIKLNWSWNKKQENLHFVSINLSIKESKFVIQLDWCWLHKNIKCCLNKSKTYIHPVADVHINNYGIKNTISVVFHKLKFSFWNSSVTWSVSCVTAGFIS